MYDGLTERFEVALAKKLLQVKNDSANVLPVN